MSRAAYRSVALHARLATGPASLPSSTLTGQCLSRRLASSTSPAPRPRSWRNRAIRWGLAAGVIYYYNTSDLFATELQPAHAAVMPALAAQSTSESPTLESIVAEKRKAAAAAAAAQADAAALEGRDDSDADGPRTAQEYEDEASSQGAFNEETGEINWDCPCLGGMAHGPCGEEFRAAFSCFVYSKEEPKGMDCIDRFKGMQDCFRRYPDVYGAELGDEEDPADEEDALPMVQAEEDSPISSRDSSPTDLTPALPTTESNDPDHGEKATQATSNHAPAPEAQVLEKRDLVQAAKAQVTQVDTTSEGDGLLPKSTDDARHDGKAVGGKK